MRNDNRLYLYENQIDLVIEAGNLYVDNRNMNLRKQVAHKGVTNEITFTIRDRDRRPQNVQSTQLFVHIIQPRTGQRLVTRELERKSAVGIVKLFLTESDLRDIPAGLYVAVVTRRTMQAGDLPVYTDQNNNITFDIEITDQAFFAPSQDDIGGGSASSVFDEDLTLDGGSASTIYDESLTINGGGA